MLQGYQKGGTAVSYTYDMNGIRRSKTVNGVLHTYFVDGTRIYSEKAGSQVYTYLYDASGITGIRTGGDCYYFLKTQQGDVKYIVSSSGVPQCEYVYDAWGNHRILSAAGEDITDNAQYANSISHINPFRYRGYYYDTETGFYYLNSRYYDPQTRRFVNADNPSIPVLEQATDIGGLNLYSYCFNNPVNMADPNGNSPEWWRWLIGGLAIVGAIVLSIATAGTAIPVLIGMCAGAVVSAGFEMGKQLISEGYIHDWAAIGIAAFGGAVAGSVSSIPVFGGFTISNYFGSSILGGIASVLGGIASGSVVDIKSIANLFALGAMGNFVAKGVQNLIVNHTTSKVFNIASNKKRSITVNNYMIKNNIKLVGLGHNSFGGWSVNMLKNMSKTTFKSVVTNVSNSRAMYYAPMLSSAISGWY